MGVTFQTHEGNVICIQNFGQPEGKRPFARPRYKWEDTIKIYLRKRGCKGMNWIQLEGLL
jgi:hypothetical protein